MASAIVFPGQGAQSVGMGKDLYQKNDLVLHLFQKAGERTGIDFESLIFEGPESVLKETKNLQPAITLINIATWQTLIRESPHISPNYVLGHSLGEISALHAAGCLDFEDTMELVLKRGRFMQECAEKNPGIMLAVLGLSAEKLRQFITDSKLELDIANFNAPGQIIVSGEKKTLLSFRKFLREHGIKKVIPLKVSGPWHSRYMKPAQEKLAGYLENVEVKEAQVPIISNVCASPVTSACDIKENLIKQVTGSVLWQDSIEYLADNNVKTLLECGPGNILTGLIKRIDSSLECTPVNTYDTILTL